MENKVTKYLNELISLREFGFGTAIKLAIISSRMSYIKRDKYEKKTKYEYLSKFINKYDLLSICNNIQIDRGSENNGPLWICWWQGENNMPPIVKFCWQKIKKNIRNREIILVNKNNYFEYISLPNHILKKFDEGIISITHLSDIIRFSLLYKYGGVWLDATILINEECNNIISKTFFTISVPDNGAYISKGRWCGFAIGGKKENPFFKFMVESFSAYWEKHDKLVDYYLIDYLIAICYDKNETIKAMFEEYSFYTEELYYLQRQFAEKIHSEHIHKIKEIPISKLTWKNSEEYITECLHNYIVNLAKRNDYGYNSSL